MTQNEILQSLLERFVSGNTTEAEEAELARYFRTASEVPAEWQAYKELFASFDTDLYAFTEAELDVMAAPAPPVEMEPAVTAVHRPLSRRFLRVAAVVTIVVGVGLITYKSLVALTSDVSPAQRPTSTVQVAQVPSAGQAEMAPSVTPARRLPSVAQDVATEDLPTVETVTEPTVAQASPVAQPPTASCGSYSDDDYEQLLEQFGSLRDIAQTVDDADATLMASTDFPELSSLQPVDISVSQTASTGSPFDGDVAFPQIAIP